MREKGEEAIGGASTNSHQNVGCSYDIDEGTCAEQDMEGLQTNDESPKSGSNGVPKSPQRHQRSQENEVEALPICQRELNEPPKVHMRGTKRRLRDIKTKGKWVKKLSMPMEEAQKIAMEITGDEQDLYLPAFSEVCRYWNKLYWMKADDVVIERIVCLLCMESIFQPAFAWHMRVVHTHEDPAVEMVLRRMAEVRVSRYHAGSVIELSTLGAKLGGIDLNSLLPFLHSIGIYVQNDEPSKTQMDSTSDRRPTSKTIDLCKQQQESTISGVEFDMCNDMAIVMADGIGTLPELLFSSSYSFRDDGSNIYQKPYEHVYCPLCRSNFAGSTSLFKDKHPKLSYHRKDCILPSGAIEVMVRMRDVRLLKYHSCNPIGLWKLRDVAGRQGTVDEEHLTNLLKTFLIERGYVINTLEESPEADSAKMDWAAMEGSVIGPSPSSSRAVSELDSDTDTPSLRSSRASSISHSRSGLSSEDRSSSACSATSSWMSDVSATGSADSMTYPILCHLPHNFQVEDAVLHVVSYVECDAEFCPNQYEYIYIMGRVMLAIVASNGCKLNVLTRLTMEDVSSAQCHDNGLRTVCFTTYRTASKAVLKQWVVLDEPTWRLLQTYIRIRERRAKTLEALSMMSSPSSLVFVSYNLKGIVARDIDYPIRQFLAKSSVRWTFKATGLKKMVEQLVVCDPCKSSVQYALDTYKQLRMKEDELGRESSVENSAIVQALDVYIDVKLRKDRGRKYGPRPTTIRGFNIAEKKARMKTNDRLDRELRKAIDEGEELISGRKLPMRKRRFKPRARRSRPVVILEESSSDDFISSSSDSADSDNEAKGLDASKDFTIQYSRIKRAVTPERGSPSRAYDVTPPRDSFVDEERHLDDIAML